jgi:hypothetical protein
LTEQTKLSHEECEKKRQEIEKFTIETNSNKERIQVLSENLDAVRDEKRQLEMSLEKERNMNLKLRDLIVTGCKSIEAKMKENQTNIEKKIFDLATRENKLEAKTFEVTVAFKKLLGDRKNLIDENLSIIKLSEENHMKIKFITEQMKILTEREQQLEEMKITVECDMQKNLEHTIENQKLQSALNDFELKLAFQKNELIEQSVLQENKKHEQNKKQSELEKNEHELKQKQKDLEEYERKLTERNQQLDDFKKRLDIEQMRLIEINKKIDQEKIEFTEARSKFDKKKKENERELERKEISLEQKYNDKLNMLEKQMADSDNLFRKQIKTQEEEYERLKSLFSKDVAQFNSDKSEFDILRKEFHQHIEEETNKAFSAERNKLDKRDEGLSKREENLFSSQREYDLKKQANPSERWLYYILPLVLGCLLFYFFKR